MSDSLSKILQEMRSWAWDSPDAARISMHDRLTWWADQIEAAVAAQPGAPVADCPQCGRPGHVQCSRADCPHAPAEQTPVACGDEAQGKVCWLTKGHSGWHESESHMWPLASPVAQGWQPIVERAVLMLEDADRARADGFGPTSSKAETALRELIAALRAESHK